MRLLIRRIYPPVVIELYIQVSQPEKCMPLTIRLDSIFFFWQSENTVLFFFCYIKFIECWQRRKPKHLALFFTLPYFILPCSKRQSWYISYMVFVHLTSNQLVQNLLMLLKKLTYLLRSAFNIDYACKDISQMLALLILLFTVVTIISLLYHLKV